MTRAETQGELQLDRATFAAIVEHARSDAPYEACGLLAGPKAGATPTRHYRVPNAARSMTYYEMDPQALLFAMREIDDADDDLVAIYHSHTHTEAFPSPTDAELAFYPGTCYLIVSLQESDAPALRGFDILDGAVTERLVTVDGEEAPTGPR